MHCLNLHFSAFALLLFVLSSHSISEVSSPDRCPQTDFAPGKMRLAEGKSVLGHFWYIFGFWTPPPSSSNASLDTPLKACLQRLKRAEFFGKPTSQRTTSLQNWALFKETSGNFRRRTWPPAHINVFTNDLPNVSEPIRT